MHEDELIGHQSVYPGDSVLLVNAAGDRVVNEKLIYHERAVHLQQNRRVNTRPSPVPDLR